MSGPRGGKTDWTDPEQVRAYRNEYWRANRDEINRRRRELRREKRGGTKPAGDGEITVDLDKRDSWNRKARSVEDVLFHAEFGMGYDEMEKYRRIKEYE